MEDIYSKSLKEIYGNSTLDQVFNYFMRLVLNLEKSGIEKLPLANPFKEPLKSFLSMAIYLIIDGQPEEVSDLILSAEYDAIIKNNIMDTCTILQLRLIKELSSHIHYDNDYYGYILSLSNLWGNEVSCYASRTFYPNMPDDIKRKYGIDGLLKYMEPGMYKLDDF